MSGPVAFKWITVSDVAPAPSIRGYISRRRTSGYQPLNPKTSPLIVEAGWLEVPTMDPEADDEEHLHSITPFVAHSHFTNSRLLDNNWTSCKISPFSDSSFIQPYTLRHTFALYQQPSYRQQPKLMQYRILAIPALLSTPLVALYHQWRPVTARRQMSPHASTVKTIKESYFHSNMRITTSLIDSWRPITSKHSAGRLI